MIDERIDITNEICPMTFVKTKLKLETMGAGQILEVTLREGEPLLNVPRSAEEDGHKVVSIDKSKEDFYKVIIEKH
ncbi:MAG: sulfurtransferase TusA family protein [Candidatus Dadabacteria bacterium]|nr:sulfurtransferase TusA family protein [Candidatus Dadabacteria bacterium]NIX16687.1 sulfurtransferase TusA family protein [Candidatus Dadabacteria bacterium]